MILKQQVYLELERIEIVENPANAKGKFAAFQFRTKSPSSHSYISSGKPYSEEFTIVWGRLPEITFYQKNYKAIDKMIWELVWADLPPDFPKDKHLFTTVSLQVSSWNSEPNDRPWSVHYQAKTYWKNGVATALNRYVPINKNTLSRILAELPTNFTEKK